MPRVDAADSSRYDGAYRAENNNPLVRTLYIPSMFLKQHRTELLVYGSVPASKDSKGTAASKNEAPDTSPLTPMFDMLNSSSGRVSNISFPAHQTVYVGDDMDGIRAIARALDRVPELERGAMVRGMANVSWSIESQDDPPFLQDPTVWLVSLEEADRAIQHMRQLVTQSSEPQDTRWLSGLMDPEVLLGVSSTAQGPLRPTFRVLIRALLAKMSASVAAEEAQAAADVAARTIQPRVRKAMADAIATWAEAAHAELRAELANALHGPNWRRLAWWKLPWRVDDVGMIVADTLRRAYLTDAEKGMIFLEGRIQEAGLLATEPWTRDATATPPSAMPPQDAVSEEPPTAEKGEAPAPDPQAQDLRQDRGPQSIAASRAILLASTVPPLEALAQSFLLNALLTTTTASALSALLYVGVSSMGAYSAGSVAAAGAALGAWQMQRGWEAAKRAWVEQVAAEGRSVLVAVERRCREVLERGGRPTEDPAAVAARRETRRAVEDVQAALEELD